MFIGFSSSNPLEGLVTTPSLIFTADNWNVPQTVTVTGVDDRIDDGNVNYFVISAAAISSDLVYNTKNASDVSVTNLDDDTAGITVSPVTGLVTTEAGGTSQFRVVLNTQPTSNVTIEMVSSDTTEGTLSRPSLSFTSTNWDVPQWVTIFGVDDFIVDGTMDYMVIMEPATSSDVTYSGLKAADVIVSNLDNDGAGIVVSPRSGLNTTEAGNSATFVVQLSTQPTNDVTIAVTSSNSNEGIASPSSLVFTPANWNLPQTVTVTGVDDFVADGDKGYAIVLSPAVSVDPDYNGLSVADILVTNLDNDVVGVIVSPTRGLTVTEAGSSASFSAVLTSQPTADVSIALTSSDLSEGTISPASLTFTSANWAIPQFVTVQGVDDGEVDGHVTFAIATDSTISSDPKYSGLNVSNIEVTNLNDDTRDLFVEDMAISTSGVLQSGSQVTLGWKLVNIGNTPTSGAWIDRIEVINMSTNQILLFANVVYDPTQVGKGDIAANSSRDLQYAFTLPIGVDSVGQLQFKVRTDYNNSLLEFSSDGFAETNNTSSVTATSQLAPAPDLIVSDLTVDPDFLESGKTITLHWKTTNNGNLATAGSWSERVRVRNSTTNNELISVELRNDSSLAGNGPLPPGASRSQSYTFQLPDGNTGVGIIEFLVTTDIRNELYEYSPNGSGETNNSTTLTKNSALANYADLVVSQVVAPGLTIGDPAQVVVSWIVTNSGNANTLLSSWQDRVVVSLDDVFGNGDDQVIATFSRNGSLAVNQSYSRSETIVLPPAFAGRFNLYVQSDAQNAIFELNEFNNVAKAVGFFDVTPIPFADLVVTSVVAPNNAFSGTPATVNWTVANHGIGVTDPNYWSDRVFLARDALGTDIVKHLGDFEHLGALGPGGSYSRSGDILLPNGLEGTFYIVVVTGGTYEFVYTENNRRVSSAFPITLTTPPDLTVVDIVAPEIAMEGDRILVSWTVKNVGIGLAPPTWTDRVRLREVGGTDRELVSVSFSADRPA